jgi:hypothetical protein
MRVVLLLIAFLALPFAAKAQDALAPFYGKWTEVEGSVRQTPPGRVDDLVSEIGRTATGFYIASFQTRSTMRIASSMSFRLTALPNVWRVESQGDPTAEATGWARLEGQSLYIDLVTLDKDGSADYQSFVRTVSGNTLKLDFRRLRNGELVRKVEAELKR